MTIRKKILSIIVVMLLGLITLAVMSAQTIVLDGFARIEEQGTVEHTERVLAALNENLDSLNSILGDWSPWDDSYEFVQGTYEGDYIAENLLNDTFTNLRVQHALFFDNAGTLIFSNGVDIETEEDIPVPQSLLTYINNTPELLSLSEPKSFIKGIVDLPEGPILLASQPILTSANEGPTAGTIILVRYLDDAERTRLSEVTRLPINVHALDSPELTADYQQARSAISPDLPITTHMINDDTIAGYSVVPDLFGEPLLMLRVDVPRDVYKQGQSSMLYLAISLLIIGLLTLGALFVLINRTILNPLGQLQSDVNAISASGNLAQRVAFTGDDELGDFSRVLNNALDTLQNSQERLRQAQQLEVVGKIAGGTAHEFNNVLAIIMGTLELVMQNLPENNPERRELEQAYTAGQRGRDLVQQILIFSRTSLQTRQPLALQTIVHNALTLVKHSLPPTITVEEELCEHCPPILANVTQIDQVVINLCNNAVQALPEQQGTLRISLDTEIVTSNHPAAADVTEGEYVKLTVQDHGVGMTPDVKERIFVPFFTTKEIGKGTGLGLAVVHGIIHQHGGHIQVESAAGQGTTFEILFPVTNEQESPEIHELLGGKSEFQAAKTQGRHQHILLVTSDTQTFRLPSVALKKMGHHLTQVETGADFLEHIRVHTENLDILLLDLASLPINIDEICQEIHNQRTPPPIIVYATGEQAKRVKTLSIEKGCRIRYLQKPVKVRQLSQTIKEIMVTSQQGDRVLVDDTYPSD